MTVKKVVKSKTKSVLDKLNSYCICCKKYTMKKIRTYTKVTKNGTSKYEVWQCKPCKRSEHIVKEFKM